MLNKENDVRINGQKGEMKIAYSIEQASDATSLSKPYLRKLIKGGQLRATRCGRRVLIRREDLERLLNDERGN
jgi:excisionase family DNA binding protein